MKKLLSVLVFASAFFSVQALHSDFKLEKNQEEFIGLYKTYLNTLSKDLDAIKGFRKLLKLSTLKKIIPKLEIDFSLEEIKNIYETTGFIQLKKIDPKDRTLVIGCGNRPFCSGGWNTDVRAEQYSKKHAHMGAVTVDPDIRKNPTIVAYFGVMPLKLLPNNHFDKIFIGGMCHVDFLLIKHSQSDLKRVLSKDGVLYYGCTQDKAYEVDKKKIWESNVLSRKK